MTSAPRGWNQTGRSDEKLPHRVDVRSRRRPTAARGIFADLHAWMKATPDQRRAWAHSAAVGRETAEYNRALILAHPDLAQRLAELYGLDRPERWTGYVPPAIGHIAENGRAEVNRSPYRAALVELVAEATRRGAP